MWFTVTEAVDFVPADIKHFPHQKVVLCPPCSSWIIDSKDSRKVGV